MPREFLSSIFTYPWDLTDEGLDTSLGRIADVAGCREVMLTPSYHVSTYFLPHNPRRPIYYGEDGAVYFTPREELYANTPIRPRVSHVVSGAGYMDEIARAIDKRGLKLGAWIVYCFNHHLAEKYPQCARHDAFGNAYLTQLSPLHPDVREYFLALTRDFVERYKPAAVYVEALSRLNWDYGFRNPKILSEITPQCKFLLSLCFNPAAKRLAQQAGIDADRFQHDVAEYLRPRLARLPLPDDQRPVTEAWIAEAFEGRLKAWLDVGRTHTTALWVEVAEIIHRHGAEIHGDGPASLASSRRNDLDPSINPHLNRASIGGVKPDDAGRAQVEGIRRQMAPGGKVLTFVSPGSHAEAGPVVQQVHDAAAAGADGATFYNYGLLREPQLGFVGQALRGV